jgi:TH1 protein
MEEQQEESDETVQAECLQAFSSPDYIMEPEVFNQLKRFLMFS